MAFYSSRFIVVLHCVVTFATLPPTLGPTPGSGGSTPDVGGRTGDTKILHHTWLQRYCIIQSRGDVLGFKSQNIRLKTLTIHEAGRGKPVVGACVGGWVAVTMLSRCGAC